MQDNLENQHIDQRFIKQSWNSLVNALDKEMPVQKSKPSALLILLTSALLLSLGALSYFIYLYHNQTPTTALTKEIIKYERIYLPQAAPELPVEYNLNSTQKKQTAKASFIQIEPSISFSDANTRIDHEIKGSSSSDTRLVKANTEQQQLAQLDIINTPELQADHKFNTLGLSTAVLIEPARQARRKFDYYFAMSGFVSNLSYSGYGVNLGVLVPISKKWGFESGIGLNFISRQYFILPFIETSSDVNLKSSEPDLANADTYYAGLKGFKQVIIPLGLSYRFNNHLSMNSGVRLRYTYTETIDRTLQTKASQRIAKSESVANTFFNNSNIGLYTGISYDFNDSFRISLDSEWGFHSIIKGTHLSDNEYRKYDLNLLNVSTYFKF